ncbi:hypothetical protein PFISCL1PPCAC_22476, partial [Pristionchus fissidentatus]
MAQGKSNTRNKSEKSSASNISNKSRKSATPTKDTVICPGSSERMAVQEVARANHLTALSGSALTGLATTRPPWSQSGTSTRPTRKCA